MRFSIVEQQDAHDAYQWHRGFAANYEFIFPRTWPDYERLILDRQVWCAREVDDFVGSAYFAFDEATGTWEIGGIMVAQPERASGVGGILARLTLGHVLVMENPIKRGHLVIAHVHVDNKAPIGLLTSALKFKMPEQPQEFPGARLRGLRKNDRGNVEGYELSMSVPDTVNALAEWCERWDGKLKDGREAEVMLPSDDSLAKWSQALRSMGH
jgi:hypothetical protein